MRNFHCIFRPFWENHQSFPAWFFPAKNLRRLRRYFLCFTPFGGKNPPNFFTPQNLSCAKFVSYKTPGNCLTSLTLFIKTSSMIFLLCVSDPDSIGIIYVKLVHETEGYSPEGYPPEPYGYPPWPYGCAVQPLPIFSLKCINERTPPLSMTQLPCQWQGGY